MTSGMAQWDLASSDVEEDLRDYLDSYFSPEGSDAHVSHQAINKVKQLLQDAVPSFATSPRLYIVLYKANLLHRRSLFFSRSLTDDHFPFINSLLHKDLDPSERSRFLEAQSLVLTPRSELPSCETGRHVYVAAPNQLPFRKVGILGSGNSTQVDIVENQTTKQRFARKLVRRGAFESFQSDFSAYLNEIKVLSRVRHKHMVSFVGSYTDPMHAALLMSPVADCDLSHYLRQPASSREYQGTLKTFFGCLATALTYLHGLGIRHKDIKPKNILIHDGEVLLADFGISRDCDNTRGTTEGRAAMTPKYASPEVADHAPRSFSSDIWSLGCVFLEMMTVLKGLQIRELSAHMSDRGSNTSAYHSNQKAVSEWMENLRDHNSVEPDNSPLEWTQEMMHETRRLRPTAHMVATNIIGHRSENERMGEFCGMCCRYEDDLMDDMDAAGVFVSQIESIDIETSIETTQQRQVVASEDSGLGLEESVMIRETLEEDVKNTAEILRGQTSPITSPSTLFGTFNQPEPEDNAIRAVSRAVSARPFPYSPLLSPASGSEALTTTNNQLESPETTVPTTPIYTQDQTPAAVLPAPAQELTVPRTSRFFLLYSTNAVNIETSAAHSIWTCNPNTNSRLDNAYRHSRSQNTYAPIFLVFSISKSRKLCGVAEMVSTVDKYVPGSEHWVDLEKDKSGSKRWVGASRSKYGVNDGGIDDGWTGQFNVKWWSFAEIDFDDVKHLPAKDGGTHSFMCVNSGTPIRKIIGLELMRRFGFTVEANEDNDHDGHDDMMDTTGYDDDAAASDSEQSALFVRE